MPPVAEVIAFWRDAGPKRWFSSDSEFDAEFRERFLDLHLAAARGEHDDRIADPDGALALALLLDQFPRNAFRDTPHMYGTDPLARELMRRAVDTGVSAQVDASLRVFLHLPFTHSEDLADQDLAVELSDPLGGEFAKFAHHHRDIVRRFGRFPHRNKLLGRESTPEEIEFLEAGGFGA